MDARQRLLHAQVEEKIRIKAVAELADTQLRFDQALHTAVSRTVDKVLDEAWHTTRGHITKAREETETLAAKRAILNGLMKILDKFGRA